MALKIFKEELLGEIEGATRDIAIEVAGETMDKMVSMINDLKTNVIPKLTQEMKEAKDQAEDQSIRLTKQVADFHVDLKEAFVMIDAAHNRALRERSDI